MDKRSSEPSSLSVMDLAAVRGGARATLFKANGLVIDLGGNLSKYDLEPGDRMVVHSPVQSR